MFSAPVFLLAIDARAAEPVEDAIVEWVASINASPDWSASYRDLAYEPAEDRAVLSGLTVSSATLGIDVAFEIVAVTGYSETPDNGFSAASITVDAGAVDAGFIKVAISDVALDSLSAPQIAAVTWDAERPFTSIIRAYAPIVAVELAHARIGLLSMVEELEGVTSRISYENFTVDDWADGRIKSLRAGPLRMESPAPEGLINMAVAGVEAENMDLDAMVHVYDPDRYVGGIGDQIWRSALGHAVYSDIAIDGPGVKMTIGGITLEDMKVRQPRQSFAAFFDQAMVDPGRMENDPESTRQAIAMLSAFGIGRLGLSELDVQAPGIDRMHLGGFAIADLSSDGLGELSIDDLEGAIADEGYLKVGRFAFGGMVFPGTDVALAAVDAQENDEDFDFKKLIPTLGFLEALGVDVESSDIPRTQLDRLRFDLANYVGPVPTLIGVDLAGIDIATVAIEDAKARRMLEDLGYERITADYALKLAWNEADESVTIDDFRLAVKDMGTITGTAELTGLKRSAIENIDTIGDALEDLSLAGGTFTFEDDSIVTRGLTLQAGKMSIEPEAFREQIAGALPFMITFIGNPDFQKQLAPALQILLRTPGTMSVTAAPAAPIAISALAAVFDSAPQTLPDLLGLTVTSTAGASPEDMPPADEGAGPKPDGGGDAPSDDAPAQ
jgi:hypothetical protein